MKRGKKEASEAGDIAVLRSKDPILWSVSEVALWLDVIGLTEYKIPFIENSISGDVLFDLNESELNSVGMTRLGHRKKMLKKLRLLQNSKPGAFNAETGGDDDSSDSGSAKDSVISSKSNKSSGSSGSKSKTKEKKVARKLSVKCHYNDEVTALKVDWEITLPSLKKKIQNEYKTAMSMKYKDEDGDLISIHKSAHLKTAIKQIKEDGNGVLRLFLEPKEAKQVQEATATLSDSEIGILENLVDGVAVIDATGNIVFFNKAAERMFGYKRTEVVGLNVKVLMPVNTGESHDFYLWRYLNERKPRIIGTGGRKVIAVAKDKTTFPIELAVTEARKGTTSIFTGTMKDLRSTQAGAQGDSKFGLLENLLQCVIVIDVVGTVQFFNRQAEKLLGYSASEVKGKNVKMLMPSPFADDHDTYLSNYISTGEAKVLGKGRDVVAKCKDKRIIPVHLSLSEEGIGRERLFTGILQPIAEGSSREGVAPTGAAIIGGTTKSVLDQEREVLKDLLVAAVVIDEKGIIQFFNKVAKDLFGYQDTEVMGKNVNMLMPSPDNEKHDRYLRKYMQGGKSKVIGVGRDVVVLTKGGKHVPVRLSVSEKRISNENRVFTGIIQKIG